MMWTRSCLHGKCFPFFRAKCFACHGEDPDEIRGELNMLTREGLLRGGESGEPSVVVGRPDASPMFLSVCRDHELWSDMPPKENDALTAQQIDLVSQWISAGAPWPDAARLEQLSAPDLDAGDGVVVRGLGGLSSDWSGRRYERVNLWAYRPLSDGPRDDLFVEGDFVDDFIRRKASAMGVPLASTADRRTLIRRATFDLLGLPPSPQEVDDFVQDPSDDATAFARLVDRLLESPHYGEQWARHWLDVVRYADSSGLANDYERGNAWRYRDYVIRAFNEDKPYDHFVREQIAGDEIFEIDTNETVKQPEVRPLRAVDSGWILEDGALGIDRHGGPKDREATIP